MLMTEQNQTTNVAQEVVKIKLYTKRVCPHCMLIKSEIDSSPIAFEVEEISIDNNDEVIEMLRSQNLMSAPIIEMNNQLYDYEKFFEYLKQNK